MFKDLLGWKIERELSLQPQTGCWERKEFVLFLAEVSGVAPCCGVIGTEAVCV